MNKIEFVQTRSHITSVLVENRYEYNPRKKFKLLQKLCFWIVHQIGCFSYDKTVSFTRHIVEPDRVVKYIHEQKVHLLDLYHYEGERILMGAKEYEKIVGDKEVMRIVTFNGQYGFGQSILGLKITIIPWMSGILVLPKLDEGR